MSYLEQALLADGVLADGRIVASLAMIEHMKNPNVLSLDTVGGNNGSGYVVGETFDIVGGTAVSINGVTLVARGVVTAISGDDVVGIKITSSGIYTSLPGVTNVVTTNASGIGDDLLTVNLTTQIAQWTEDRNDFTDLLTNFEWIATSIKATNAPTVGVVTILSGANDGFQLMVASSFNSGATFLTQPGAPPDNEMFFACPNQDPDVFISTTERRMNVLVSDGTNKQYAGIGLFVPFTNSDLNYPFPALCHGQARSVLAINTARGSTNSGIVNLNSYTIAGQLGPVQYRDNVSPAWLGIALINNSGAEDQDSQLWPISLQSGGSFAFTDAPVPSGSSAPASGMDPYNLNPNPGAGTMSDPQWFQNAASGLMPQGPAPLGPGGRLALTAQLHIIKNQPGDVQVIGIVDGWEHVHGRGLDAFDEIISFDGRRFLVFNDTNSPDIWRFVAMEKL
jgi:hypothetical protein